MWWPTFPRTSGGRSVANLRMQAENVSKEKAKVILKERNTWKRDPRVLLFVSKIGFWHLHGKVGLRYHRAYVKHTSQTQMKEKTLYESPCTYIPWAGLLLGRGGGRAKRRG